MKITCGSTAEKELASLLARYDILKQTWAARGLTDLALNFFDNSKSPVYKLDCSFVNSHAPNSSASCANQSPSKCDFPPAALLRFSSRSRDD
jgi:hypothetical protein